MANTFTVPTYSPSSVDLVVGGYTLSGWDRISIARRTEMFKPVYGVRGKHTRVRTGGKETRDTSTFITVVLSKESQANDVLSEIHRQDIENGTARISLTLKDKSGSSIFSSNEAYIIKYADSEFTNDFGAREWRLFCQTTETYLVGGNVSGQSSLLDSAINEVSSFISGVFR